MDEACVQMHTMYGSQTPRLSRPLGGYATLEPSLHFLTLAAGVHVSIHPSIHPVATSELSGLALVDIMLCRQDWTELYTLQLSSVCIQSMHLIACYCFPCCSFFVVVVSWGSRQDQVKTSSSSSSFCMQGSDHPFAFFSRFKVHPVPS